jgi:hypothetical protein
MFYDCMPELFQLVTVILIQREINIVTSHMSQDAPLPPISVQRYKRNEGGRECKTRKYISC